MLEEQWTRICLNLESEIGSSAYKSWIDPLKLYDIEGSIAKFIAPTVFMGNWVQRNYGQKIHEGFRKEGIIIDRLIFNVTELSLAKKKKPSVSVKKDKSVFDKNSGVVLPSSPLDSRFTFSNFVVGKPNELAHAAARRVAESGAVTFNPLFLYGGVGLGKTHLMHAIAWEVKSRLSSSRILYLSAEQFMYRFVQALRFKDMHGFKELFRSVDVLMVDDVQFIAGKESTQDEFFHTFNALIDQKKQIVISADRAPGEIDGLEERIRSRLQCGLVVDLHPTDYELRLGILQEKVQNYRSKYTDLDIANGVLEFLAHKITTNVRVLEGALTRLFAFSSLVGRQITLDMAQESLADILRASDRKVTMDEIMKKICHYYNVRMSDLLSPRRSRNIARPRQMAMYLSKNMTSRSYPEIGKQFGNRDHTTVMHAVKKIEELKSQDSQVSDDAELLRRMLEA